LWFFTATGTELADRLATDPTGLRKGYVNRK
jgi:hypothetical protein